MLSPPAVPEIKICGICNAEDAQMAIDYGARYIGLIFIKTSPRYIDPRVAQAIVASINKRAIVVGVFQNSTLEEMENIASAVGLDYFQLHGHESQLLCESLSKPVIKSFQIADRASGNESCITISFNDNDSLSILNTYYLYCNHFLFDKSKEDLNSDWLDSTCNYLNGLEPKLGHYFISGGLNIQNIQMVLQQIKPAVVDIASGIEENSRIKSRPLTKEFCSKVNLNRKKIAEVNS